MSDIVTSLIVKLTRLLVEEVKYLKAAKENVMLLRKELRFMSMFLKEMEGRRKENNDMVAEVVSQIREVVHDAEDVIDTYIANVIKQERRNVVARNVPLAPIYLLDVQSKISKIKEDIDEVFKNRSKYGVQEGEIQVEEGERIRKQRELVVEGKHVVGFEKESKAVIDHLMKDDSSLQVVSIVGMGGLGKTNLANKIFNNDKVQGMFPCRAWGYVSNDYRPSEFYLSLLKGLLSMSEYEDLVNSRYAQGASIICEEVLKLKVRDCLNKSNKYLVVVDDIWEELVWNEVKSVFPDNNNGSRILMTTRLAELASHTAGTAPIYKLPLLNKQQSWELLSQKVFGGEKCPSYLETMGRFIAESCGGLPLAIIVMARILANKKSQSEYWCSIKEHVNWHLGRDQMLKGILKLSYDNLPLRLKPCFLYLGMFPEHYDIPVKHLIRLWISEGFLIQGTSITPDMPEQEYIGKEYLDELVERSLVKVVSRSTDGSVKTCRLHSTFRNLCIVDSKDDKFFDVCTGIDFQTLETCPRRLSLHDAPSTFTSESQSQSCISTMRSLLCFDTEEADGKPVQVVMKTKHLKSLLNSFKLVHVLDLGRIKIESLPCDFERLIHLRYLRIHSVSLETVPTCICKLWNLETLDLRGSPIKSFPAEFWKLEQLRHLLMSKPVPLSSETKPMPNLQTLSSIELQPNTISLLDNRTFPRLTELGFHYQKNNPVPEGLRYLNHLRKLKMIVTTRFLHHVSKVLPSSLTKVTLKKFHFLKYGTINTLGNLPNLYFLKLSSQKSSASFTLHFGTGSFPQLQVFIMVGIKVRSWTIEKGSMPQLQRVVLRTSEFFTPLPDQLHSLSIEKNGCLFTL